MRTILIAVVLVLLFGGGGGYYARGRLGSPGPGGVFGAVRLPDETARDMAWQSKYEASADPKTGRLRHSYIKHSARNSRRSTGGSSSSPIAITDLSRSAGAASGDK